MHAWVGEREGRRCWALASVFQLRSVGCGVSPLPPLYQDGLYSHAKQQASPGQVWDAFTPRQNSGAASGVLHALRRRAEYTLPSQQNHNLQTSSVGNSLYQGSAPFSRVKINIIWGEQSYTHLHLKSPGKRKASFLTAKPPHY